MLLLFHSDQTQQLILGFIILVGGLHHLYLSLILPLQADQVSHFIHHIDIDPNAPLATLTLAGSLFTDHHCVERVHHRPY